MLCFLFIHFYIGISTLERCSCNTSFIQQLLHASFMNFRLIIMSLMYLFNLSCELLVIYSSLIKTQLFFFSYGTNKTADLPALSDQHLVIDCVDSV